jgi:hypothetical protein
MKFFLTGECGKFLADCQERARQQKIKLKIFIERQQKKEKRLLHAQYRIWMLEEPPQ